MSSRVNMVLLQACRKHPKWTLDWEKRFIKRCNRISSTGKAREAFEQQAWVRLTKEKLLPRISNDNAQYAKLRAIKGPKLGGYTTWLYR